MFEPCPQEPLLPKPAGSGRTGGTNVLRVPGAGRPAFVLTVLGDISKGFVAVLLGRVVGGDAGVCLVDCRRLLKTDPLGYSES